MASSESRPESDEVHGNAQDGQQGVAGYDAGQVGGTAGGGDDHFHALRFEFPHQLQGALRGAVGGTDLNPQRDLQAAQQGDSLFHLGKIRIRTQYIGYLGFHLRFQPISRRKVMSSKVMNEIPS